MMEPLTVGAMIGALLVGFSVGARWQLNKRWGHSRAYRCTPRRPHPGKCDPSLSLEECERRGGE